MVTISWVIATILVIDLLIVFGFVALEVVDRRRVRREVTELDALWRAPVRSPVRRARFGGVVQAEPRRRTRSWPRAGEPPRLISNVALVTAVSAMLILVVVAAVGGPTSSSGATTQARGPLGSALDQGMPIRDPGSREAAGTVEQPLAEDRGGAVPSDGPPAEMPRGEAPVPATFAAHAASSSSIVLLWAPVPAATGYEIERRSAWDGPQAWSLIETVDHGETRFRDSDLESATTYFYRVTALMPAGVPGFSDVISATTPVEPPPATSLSVLATSSSTISLMWVDVQGETGYVIERSTPGDPKWTEIATAGADVTEFVDGGLTSGTKYRYRVFSVGDGGKAESSNTAHATTDDEPGATTDPPGTGEDPPGSGKGNDPNKGGGPTDDSDATDGSVSEGTDVGEDMGEVVTRPDDPPSDGTT